MKNIIKTIGISVFCVFAYAESNAQGPYGYYNDALTFSQRYSTGTARIQGLGGVQIGLGGDVSSISSNPAGLGFFNRSEISFSPSLKIFNNQTDYSGGTTEDFGNRFFLDNLNVVFNKTKDAVTEGEWRGGSFGISYSKVNNFSNEFQYLGINPGTSIIDYFLDASYGIPSGDFQANIDNDNKDLLDLAYEHQLIFPALNENGVEAYYSLAEGYPSRQSETVRTSGAQSQWSLSYGGNFSDKYYFGGGIGISSIDYRVQKRFREVYENENLTDFDITESNNISGIGINATIGVIVKPIEVLRIGASIVSPTIYFLEEVNESAMNSTYITGNPNEDPTFSSFSSILRNEYSLRTPMRLNGGVAYFFNKNGFIGADVEYVNHMSGRLSSKTFSMQEDNQAIKDNFSPVVNFKLGGEYRFNIFRFRAGGGYYGDPYAYQSESDRSRISLSAGAGVRLPNFYVDLAVVRNAYNSQYRPYETTISSVPTALTSNSDVRGIITVGFNF